MDGDRDFFSGLVHRLLVRSNRGSGLYGGPVDDGCATADASKDASCMVRCCSDLSILYTEADVEKEGLTVPAVSSLEAVLDSNLSSGAVLPYQNTGYITQYNGEDPLNTFSMMGNAYAQGLALEASYSGDTTEFLFNLGGGFQEFSAVIGHLDNKGTAAATINVYADGELVEQLPLAGNMACYTYTLNVQGVNQLRFTREGRSSYGYGLANITLS